jgi:hypothetical protein
MYESDLGIPELQRLGKVESRESLAQVERLERRKGVRHRDLAGALGLAVLPAPVIDSE